MKKTSIVLAAFTLIFGVLLAYFMFYADSGPDGLSNFMLIVLFGVLFICVLLAFLVSVIPRKAGSSKHNWIIGLVVGLPILGLLPVSGVFGYAAIDYENEYDNKVEINKSVLKTLHFEDNDFGVSFDHISGNVRGYRDGELITVPITPKIENGVLMVPVDDESYSEPDVLMKLEQNSNEELSIFLDSLKVKVQLPNAKFKKVTDETFFKLSADTEIWLAENNGIPYKDRLKLTQHFLPQVGAPEMLHFIKSPKKPNIIWVLIIWDATIGAAASVEKLSASNFSDDNLWFQTLEFID